MVSAVVMGLSHTIAKERMFLALRQRCGGPDSWLGYLVSCPYCLSHWVAFVLVPLTGTYPLRVVVAWGPLSDVLDWLLSSILITVVAAFLRIVFYFVDEKQGLTRSEKEQVRKETARADDVRSPDAQQPV